ncbi:MAG: PhzF family phenazine biosynthesis isomerase [Proteobacteria bacterium]|nr:PhzF family phenazine biosynthesis isomerase [Pseudomonadota bacterium]
MLEHLNSDNLKALAQLLNPWFEICLFSAKTRQLLVVYHALSAHKQDENCPEEIPTVPFIESLKSGKKTKTSYLKIQSEEFGEVIMRLRFDITWFTTSFEEINRFIGSNNSSPQTPWEESANQMIETFLVEKSLNLSLLNRLEKRELILMLYEKGLLNYKDSTLWLANRLHLSRATVYNHLNWAKSVRKIHVHQVDAFSETPFGGNPAGVVLDADLLEESMMRSITREMNNAETSFISSSKEADFRLRYFTPSGQEMIFCGHSTVGALYMLAKEKRMRMTKPGAYQFKVETLAGIISMGCEISKEGDISVNFYSPKIVLSPAPFAYSELAQMLGLSLKSINTKHQIYYEQTNKDLYISVQELKDLKAIDCDVRAMNKFCKNNDITVICVSTPQAFSSDNQIHMRCFAPSVGINEDLFTGSVIGGLIVSAYKNKIITQQKGEIGIEQGHFLERPGSVKVKYVLSKDNYQVQIIAKANHLFSSQIQLS